LAWVYRSVVNVSARRALLVRPLAVRDAERQAHARAPVCVQVPARLTREIER
jgi:hypothetical protein